EPGSLPEVLGEGRPEEPGRGHGERGSPEPLVDELPQARAHRVADGERACEHRHGDGDAGNDGQMRAPVVSGAPEDERDTRHGERPIAGRAGAAGDESVPGSVTRAPRCASRPPGSCAAPGGARTAATPPT